MSDLETIRAALTRAGRRRRWERAWRSFWNGFLVAAILALFCLTAYKLFPIPRTFLLVPAILIIVLPIATFLHGWFRRMTLGETARWLDESGKLQERLSTALEVAADSSQTQWNSLLLADAAAQARLLDPRKLLPIRLPAACRWAVPVLALAAGLGFVPEYRSQTYLAKKQDAVAIKEAGKQLAVFSKHTINHRPPALASTRENIESIEQLGNQLSTAPLTRDEALKNLATATDKLKSDLKELGKNPALQPLERQARAEARQGGASASELQKKIEALEKSLEDKVTDTSALEKLKEDLAKAQMEAKAMAGNTAQDTASARQKLAQSLSELAQRAQDMGLNLDNLEDAIAALQANQTDVFLKDLDLAMHDLGQLQEMAKALNQLQQQATAKLGKDLAEQLKNGQADAAAKTLREMAQRLAKSELSEADLKKLLEQLEKALDPAKPYGDVEELLKMGKSQLESGQPGEGGKNLAKAAEALEDLLQQMNDAKSLQATLAALQKAQMCVSNGGTKSGRGGIGKGGKAGSGVGTWADEEGWLYYPEFTERWDNTGQLRPDMDPRGLTDRGEGELADTLAPTKIKGQLNPGGSMPSITLKGVSIKGQSKVDFQEAVSAAQSDAQSALNQDQVPRAYQGAVKNYFDDLQE